jgi:coenzyme F420-reducing hydrogenase alpha subunit
LYCGEWIESHALHIFMLHAPDFLGYPDVLRLARDYPEVVKMGLKLKKVGNDLVSFLGGREIHPINVKVGGFYKVPAKEDLAPWRERLNWARDAALTTVRWVAGFSFPDFEQDYEFVALRHPQEYPLNEGRLVSNRGLNIAVKDYDRHFVEEQAPYTHALQSSLKERGPYLVGPLARYNLNFDRLSPGARDAAREASLTEVCRNPFKSIIVRSVELLHAVDEALAILEAYERPEQPAIPVTPGAGVGFACTEAPRGILYHRYHLDDKGVILDAKIVPPTAQNQKTMESDLFHFVGQHLDLPDDQLTWKCEQAVRNYDPCISCATHCLKVEVERK